MSRTRRCAPSVEAELFWLHVAPARNGGFIATMAVEPPPGPWHRLPILVMGEGETVAKATGAATAAAWKALNEARRTRCEHDWSRVGVGLATSDDANRFLWRCGKCGRVESRPQARGSGAQPQVEMDLEAGKEREV